MEKGNPCERLSKKTYGQVLSDETSRKQLMQCLRTSVFEIVGLKPFYDESNRISIELTDQFFREQTDFLWHDKPSDTKVKRFYYILVKLQRDFGQDFVLGLSDHSRPSLTNLSLKLKFPLRKFLQDEEQKIDSVIIEELIRYLRKLWQNVLQRLSYHGYELK
jgi:hypothetical protein